MDLAKINNMYRFSLASFLRLFQRALDADSSTGSMDMRIRSLNACLQRLIYEYVCRYANYAFPSFVRTLIHLTRLIPY